LPQVGFGIGQHYAVGNGNLVQVMFTLLPVK